MTFGQFLAFNITLLVAIASPGPALLLTIKTTLSGGRRAHFQAPVPDRCRHPRGPRASGRPCVSGTRRDR